MIPSLHRNRRRRSLHRVLVAAFTLLPAATAADAQDDPADLLRNARPATTAPASVSSPDAPDFRAPGSTTTRPPEGARTGTLLLSDGTKLEGTLWTTLQTPFRLWIEDDKTYHDVDMALVTRIDVHVIKEGMEDDWRWLREGSDQMVYSGKKYPNVELTYRFTLLNGQTLEGGVVAPIYFQVGAGKARTLALYKKYKGALDQTMKDLVYIKEIQLAPPPAASPDAPAFTRKLPLLED